MTSLRLRLPFALLLVACPGSSDDEGGDTSGNTETASTTATTATTATMTTESSTTEPATTAAESSSSEGASTESTATAEESSTGGGDVCAPHDGDDACVACTRMSCCGQVMGCTNNPDCAAVFGCLAGINQPSVDEQMMCAADEGVDFNMVSAFLQQVYQCRMAICADDCPE